jgi:hypothetical protein
MNVLTAISAGKPASAPSVKKYRAGYPNGKRIGTNDERRRAQNELLTPS